MIGVWDWRGGNVSDEHAFLDDDSMGLQVTPFFFYTEILRAAVAKGVSKHRKFWIDRFQNGGPEGHRYSNYWNDAWRKGKFK